MRDLWRWTVLDTTLAASKERMLMVCFWVLAAVAPTHGGSSASALRFFSLLGWLANQSCSGSVFAKGRGEEGGGERRERSGADGWVQRRREGEREGREKGGRGWGRWG
ncbi:hypothetical protein D8674_019372 [Pyrus ussuriensis x Pyrus communis]|uniref:Uncharacterized protein n=1 Tax=Pyrus ussuriensis x Pyrus communis TaxID=2448454 RepID=A0A5N5GCW5_9ROSA|nr:hypothetical protein D8674_019372 [Pyrus ussuriensis x Pyrus communis]